MDLDHLLKLMRDVTQRTVAGSDRVAVAYSGGIDSAVVERVASEEAKTVCYTCAVRGSYDYARAPLAAAEAGLDLTMIVLEEKDVEDLVAKAAIVLRTCDPLRAAYTAPIISVIDRSELDLVLVGTGADELFGGYAKYLEDDDLESSMDADTKKMQSENDLLRGYANSVGKRIGTPFDSPEVVSFAKELSADRKIKNGERKVILREAARSLGVLSHDAPKKAAQYSSGIMKAMRRMAKEQGMDLHLWTQELADRRRRIP